MESFSLSSLFSSPFTLLVTTLVIIGVLKVISVLHYQITYWKKRGVPFISISTSFGMSWKMLLHRVSIMDYNSYLYNCIPDAKYFGSMDMSTPLLILRDPEIIRDIMVKDFEHFPDHRTFGGSEDLEPLFSKNVSALHGNRWKEMRNTLSPSFTASKMKFMFELVSKCAREFSKYMAEHPEQCSSINTKEIFRRYTTDVIATSAFGISVNSMKDRDNEFFTKGIESTNLNNLRSVCKFLLFRISPRLTKALGINLLPPATSQFFKRIVAETIKVREEQGIIRPDMIHLLMQARNKEGPSVHEMTLDDIVAQAFVFFLAGFETTATLMCFLAHELAAHPDIQDRLWKEVERSFAEGNGEISYESVSKMVYMDMVVNETLRMFPPAIFIDRICVKTYELPPSKPGAKSLSLEPNSQVLMPVYALHRDPKYFPDPDKFDPERFSDKNKDNIVPYSYMPFGHGPRKCIANRFALMETKLLVAHLLHEFVFKPTEKTIYPIVFDKKQFSMQPEGGFWIALEKREK